MSTGYSWEGIRQVRATLLGARHVPERLCTWWLCLLKALYQVFDLFTLTKSAMFEITCLFPHYLTHRIWQNNPLESGSIGLKRYETRSQAVARIADRSASQQTI